MTALLSYELAEPGHERLVVAADGTVSYEVLAAELRGARRAALDAPELRVAEAVARDLVDTSPRTRGRTEPVVTAYPDGRRATHPLDGPTATAAELLSDLVARVRVTVGGLLEPADATGEEHLSCCRTLSVTVAPVAASATVIRDVRRRGRYARAPVQLPCSGVDGRERRYFPACIGWAMKNSYMASLASGPSGSVKMLPGVPPDQACLIPATL